MKKVTFNGKEYNLRNLKYYDPVFHAEYSSESSPIDPLVCYPKGTSYRWKSEWGAGQYNIVVEDASTPVIFQILQTDPEYIKKYCPEPDQNAVYWAAASSGEIGLIDLLIPKNRQLPKKLELEIFTKLIMQASKDEVSEMLETFKTIPKNCNFNIFTDLIDSYLNDYFANPVNSQQFSYEELRSLILEKFSAEDFKHISIILELDEVNSTIYYDEYYACLSYFEGAMKSSNAQKIKESLTNISVQLSEAENADVKKEDMFYRIEEILQEGGLTIGSLEVLLRYCLADNNKLFLDAYAAYRIAAKVQMKLLYNGGKLLDEYSEAAELFGLDYSNQANAICTFLENIALLDLACSESNARNLQISTYEIVNIFRPIINMSAIDEQCQLADILSGAEDGKINLEYVISLIDDDEKAWQLIKSFLANRAGQTDIRSNNAPATSSEEKFDNENIGGLTGQAAIESSADS